tara:strand:- start:89 stop:817 length:729 start_codon:yes stop_codon:yes gene_type:complete
MYPIIVKEIQSYFSSLIAYVVISVFLLIVGLFMWIYPNSNVFDFGYANLDTLFLMAPYIFIFLISAITMKSFSEEYRLGTFELLTTTKVTDMQIVLGKFVANFCIVCITLLPTLLYVYTIHHLGAVKGNFDQGATLGSYIGLLLLSTCYISIGMFASSLSKNQIISFLLAMAFCYFFYESFKRLSELQIFGKNGFIIEWLGIDYHYFSVSRGVIDSRDLLYFLGFVAIFLGCTKWRFSSRLW